MTNKELQEKIKELTQENKRLTKELKRLKREYGFALEISKQRLNALREVKISL